MERETGDDNIKDGEIASKHNTLVKDRELVGDVVGLRPTAGFLACGEWLRQMRDSNPRRFILVDS